mmetsp:Transcript_22063/g.38855  ORF Transcript_22063/g.38855 Transcript_22063/m.38855 type:complete len:181 (-) Transcript_22063:69-611(-)
MTTTTEYKLLDTYDTLLDAKPLYPQATAESKNYPGARRQVLDGKPPSGSILVKTGGNALQAIDRETAQQRNIISFVVSPGRSPGDIVLVQCPYSDRLISVTIPKGAVPGQVILVKSPPMESTNVSSFDENGIPVGTEYDDLRLAAEHELEKRHFGGNDENPSQNAVDNDSEEDFEMTPRV